MVNDTDSSLVVKSKCGGAWFGEPFFGIFPSEIINFSMFLVTQLLFLVCQERKTGLPNVYPAGTVYTVWVAPPGSRKRAIETCRDLLTFPPVHKVHVHPVSQSFCFCDFCVIYIFCFFFFCFLFWFVHLFYSKFHTS